MASNAAPTLPLTESDETETQQPQEPAAGEPEPAEDSADEVPIPDFMEACMAEALEDNLTMATARVILRDSMWAGDDVIAQVLVESCNQLAASTRAGMATRG